MNKEHPLAKKSLIVKSQRPPKYPVRAHNRCRLCGRWDLTISDFFAKGCSFYAQAGERAARARRSWLVLITKWHTETFQQRVALCVIGCGGDNCYLQTANFIYLVVLNFWENDLLTQSQTIVATTIE